MKKATKLIIAELAEIIFVWFEDADMNYSFQFYLSKVKSLILLIYFLLFMHPRHFGDAYCDQ